MSLSEETVKLKNQIKYMAANNGLNLRMLVEKLHNQYDRSDNVSSFSTRLKRGSLSLLEFLEVLEVLGYDMEFKDRKY